jgi:aminoglycoside phosphotransferase (APT) family kinase protein
MDAPAVEASIDPRAVLASLGLSDTSEPVRVVGGWDTLLWKFRTPDGAEHSLRVHYLPDREEFARREAIAMEACAAAGLPAPRVEVSSHFEGLPAMVLSWCPGRPILSFIEKRPWTLLRMSRLMGRAQARMHAVPPPAEFVASAPDDWLSRVDEPYADLAAHARTLGLASSSLIHMDFHPLNVVSDGRQVTGIVDWARAGAGDPRADLARTEIIILAAPVPPGPLKPLLNLTRNLLLRSWRAGYRELAGPLPDYRPLRAWAGATLLAEMELVIDKPEVWGTQEDIERFRSLVEGWAREYGIR